MTETPQTRPQSVPGDAPNPCASDAPVDAPSPDAPKRRPTRGSFSPESAKRAAEARWGKGKTGGIPPSSDPTHTPGSQPGAQGAERGVASPPDAGLAQGTQAPRPISPLDLLEPLIFHHEPSWANWRTLIRAAYALPPEPGDLETFQKFSGRTEWPTSPAEEVWVISGRGSGKSRVASALGLHHAIFATPRPWWSVGESIVVPVLASDREQAGVIFKFVRETLATMVRLNPSMKAVLRIRRDTRESLELGNRVVIQVKTASFRGIRGPSFLAAFGDEIAFWRDDTTSANPDKEILIALRPGLKKGGRHHRPFITLTTPYAKRGETWRTYREHFGVNGDPILVWQSGTRDLNPTFPQEVIERAMLDDPASAKAEYLGEFRSDIESFISEDVLQRCVVPGRRDLLPAAGVRYAAFIDSSAGSSDSFTCCIGHHDPARKVNIVDKLVEHAPPFSPPDVVASLAPVLRSYGIRSVTGDHYTESWLIAEFAKHGITYKVAEQFKSDLYAEFLPQLTSGRVELPDHQKLLAQARSLDRRTGASGRDTIDHLRGMHDDLINSVAGLCVTLGVGYSAEAEYLRSWIRSRGGLPASESPVIPGITRVGRPIGSGGSPGAAGGAVRRSGINARERYRDGV